VLGVPRVEREAQARFELRKWLHRLRWSRVGTFT